MDTFFRDIVQKKENDPGFSLGADRRNTSAIVRKTSV